MNVASLELSKQLWELSGWEDSFFYYNAENDVEDAAMARLMHPTRNCPAYDLGYLLRNLPHRIEFKDFELHKVYDDDWTAAYTYQDEWVIHCDADTPEDAATKLCIKLFKQKILVKEGES